MEPKVTCVVLNWNGWPETVACLRALEKIRYDNLDVFVVDNGSTDDSLQQIRKAHSETILIEAGGNLGFAGGNNVGIATAIKGQTDYIWLLNNDAEPAPNALVELVNKAKSDPGLGAVGSVLFYADSRNAVQTWGGGKVNRWRGFSIVAHSPRPDEWFDYITAASMLVPRRAFEEVGLLDDRLFLYWDDVDFSFRLRKHSWKLGVAPLSYVRHKVGASLNDNSRDRYSTASGIRIFLTYSPLPWLSIVIFLGSRLGKRLLTGQFRRLLSVGQGIRDYLSQGRRNDKKQSDRALFEV